MKITTKIIIAILALSAPLYCIAGRPVFQNLSLAELVRSADIIAVVSKNQPFEVTRKGKFGCDQVQWHLTVQRFLKTQGQDGPDTKSMLRALSNVNSARDCELREGWKTTGASFAALRYSPSKQSATADPQFIVFLTKKNGGLELVTDNAFESMQRQGEIEALVR